MNLHLDLFSGVGGFALVAKRTGWKTIGFSEIEPYACKILKRHWPDVPNYGDVRNVPVVKCDLISGGFPCQPFSQAGKRRGASDDRALWPQMLRVITESKPRWVLGENVPGIISMELDSVLSDLENIGYSAWPIVIPACAVDARHRRDRVWIVANSSGVRGWTRQESNGQRIETSNSRKDVADSNQQGLRTERTTLPRSPPVSNASCELSHGSGPARNRRTESSDFCQWLPEPELGRVANGIPNRAHRLKGLGNAIVPAVAEVLLRMMTQADLALSP